MDRLPKYFSLIIFIFATSIVQAKSVLMHPYIGLDFKQIWTGGQSDYKNLVANDYPGLNIYIGSSFDRMWALEIGYDISRKEKKSYLFETGSSFFGATASGVQTEINARFTQWYLDWRGILPATNQIDLSASFGIGLIKPKISIYANDVAGIGVDEVIDSISTDKRAIWRLGFGASYMLTDKLSFRTNFRYEGYDRVRLKGNFSDLNGQPARPFSRALTLSLGFLLHF